MYVTIELFQRAVETLTHLLAGGSLRVLLGGTRHRNLVQFELHGSDPNVAHLEENGFLSRADLERASYDVADILGFLISPATVDDIAEARSDRGRLPDAEVEDPDTAAAKAHLVEQAFDIQSLARRAYAKMTSRIPLSTRVDWEVVRRFSDDRWPVLSDAPPLGIATLTTERSDYDPYAPEEGEELMFLLDLEDVGYMIDSLTRLKAALERAEEQSK